MKVIFQISLVILLCSILIKPVHAEESNFQGFLESVQENQKVTSNILDITGWVIHPDGISQVDVFIDRHMTATADYGVVREDVEKAYPSITGSRESGYKTTVDLTHYKDGPHSIQIIAVNKKGEKGTVGQRNFKLALIDQGEIETPKKARLKIKGNKLRITGWVKSNQSIKQIQFWIDNQLVGSKELTSESFSYTLDISKVYRGEHTFKVTAQKEDGSSFTVGSKTFSKPFNYPLLAVLIVLLVGFIILRITRKNKVH